MSDKKRISVGIAGASGFVGRNLIDELLKNEDLGLKESGIDRVAKHGYDILDLGTFFTSGPTETRAWTIKKNALAPEAAGKIHTDFQKGFIRAEVISYDDYVNLKGTANSKNEGKMRLEGKDYEVNEGDIVVFRYNV